MIFFPSKASKAAADAPAWVGSVVSAGASAAHPKQENKQTNVIKIAKNRFISNTPFLWEWRSAAAKAELPIRSTCLPVSFSR